jgi:hypothetical protein
MRIITKFDKFITESASIQASEAYRDLSSIQTLIDKKRGVAYLATSGDPRIDNSETIESMKLAEKNGISKIEVKNRTNGKAWVFYNDMPSAKENAEKLAAFASTKEGYLNDETPEEARLVGKLLSYDISDVEEYIKRRYK